MVILGGWLFLTSEVPLYPLRSEMVGHSAPSRACLDRNQKEIIKRPASGLKERPASGQYRVSGIRPPRDRELLYMDVQRFRGGLVSKAHRPWYHSTLGLRVKKKKKKS